MLIIINKMWGFFKQYILMFLRTHWGFHCCFLPGQLLKSSGWSNIYNNSQTPPVRNLLGFSWCLILLTLFLFCRYSMYAINLFSSPPFPLTWLRCSLQSLNPNAHCVTRAPLLYFIRSWVALSFKVVSEWVRQASVTPVQISTFCNI